MKRLSLKLMFMFSFLLMITITLISCKKELEDITILYTNDIHGYIANTVKENNKDVPGLRLDNIAAYKQKLKDENKNVLLIDSGDEIQGSVYGAIDMGVEMVNILNKSGFDLATPGNHDFDFGMDGFERIVRSASYPFISCNFKSLADNKNVLDSYKIFEFGNTKIGFVGVSTPESITSSTPKFFQNEKGEFIYTFDGLKNKNDLYESVQNAINQIRNEVNYLIVLGHLGVGVEQEKAGVRSIDVINNTTGIDAFIDGHSHTVMEKQIVKTKDNKDCVLTQTGYYLNGFGEMTITKNGEISTKLINKTEEHNEEVTTLENSLIQHVNSVLGQKIAYLEKPLYIDNPDNLNQRLVRARETNLGDFTADSIYWYINDYKDLDCDISFVNGGGVRDNLNSGDITYLEAKTVEPFGNQVCLIKTKGINIKNALEMGVDVLDKWDTDWDTPAENGGFLQVSGLTFEVDCSVKSSVEVDENGMFKFVNGDYRVKNIKVYNKTTNIYEDFDINKEYTVGSINYLLRNSGNGLSMFKNSINIVDYIAEDYMILADYMKNFKSSNNDIIINNANSPLNKYNNFMLDYENPSGAGRIKILNL